MGIRKGKPIAWHLGSCTLQEDKKRQLSPCLTTYGVFSSKILQLISSGNWRQFFKPLWSRFGMLLSLPFWHITQVSGFEEGAHLSRHLAKSWFFALMLPELERQPVRDNQWLRASSSDTCECFPSRTNLTLAPQPNSSSWTKLEISFTYPVLCHLLK